MIGDALEVGVFVEHRVVCVQEKLEGVLVEEVHLEEKQHSLLMRFILKITQYYFHRFVLLI